MTAPAWVLHAGALGDSVMLWPLLRAVRARVGSVAFAARASHAALAQGALGAGIAPLDVEQRRLNLLWSDGFGAVRPTLAAEALPDVRHVICGLVDPSDPRGARWRDAAAALFPRAAITLFGAPGSASRAAVWEAWDVGRRGSAPAAPHRSGGPTVLHVGAGGEANRWPLDRWLELADRLRRGGDAAVVPVAGEVEAERWSATDLKRVTEAGGRLIRPGREGLLELLALLRDARRMAGADTGPTHLAAQLGVPTVALFGPTDAAVWAPAGPCVRVLSPPRPGPMEWLEPALVEEALASMDLEEPGR